MLIWGGGGGCQVTGLSFRASSDSQIHRMQSVHLWLLQAFPHSEGTLPHQRHIDKCSVYCFIFVKTVRFHLWLTATTAVELHTQLQVFKKSPHPLQEECCSSSSRLRGTRAQASPGNGAIYFTLTLGVTRHCGWPGLSLLKSHTVKERGICILF